MFERRDCAYHGDGVCDAYFLPWEEDVIDDVDEDIAYDDCR